MAWWCGRLDGKKDKRTQNGKRMPLLAIFVPFALFAVPRLSTKTV
jgi:hypothetical protein